MVPLIHFLNRDARWGEPLKNPQTLIVRVFILQIWSALPIQEINYGSANTIGFVNVHILNRQSRSKGKMVKKWQGIAY